MNVRQVVTFVALAILPACGSTGITEQPTYTVDVTPVSVALTLGGASATATLNATITRKLGANAVVDNTATVMWTTSDANVATVVGNGRTATVTGTGQGTATITASSNNGSGSTAVSVTTPINVSFVRMIGGGSHTCALTASGETFCWGANESGQIGDSSRVQRLTPSRVRTNLRFAALAAGGSHTCVIGSPGSASSCWGDGQYGQLGDGTGNTALLPISIGGGQDWAALTAGDRHTCGIASNAVAYCWGEGISGQLGTGKQGNETIPAAVQGNLRFDRIAAGGSNTCALTVTGDTYCWGSHFGFAPVLIAGGLRFTTLRLGASHVCGLVADGTAYCLGNNQFGQLGTGGTGDSPTPTRVQTDLRFIVLEAAGNHTCGLVNDGAAYCWGANSDGQLGIGFISPSQAAPARVVGGFTFSGIRGGSRHTCGLANVSGAAICWGSNSSGQLGDGTTATSSSPVFVRGGF